MPLNRKKSLSLKSVAVALIFFFNPNIGILDLLPDFIGALLFMRLLRHPAELSPYFAEARSAFGKLALCDACKFFCQFTVLGTDRAVGVGDTSAMLSITFFVLDTIFAFIAVKYLFDGLFYLGERSDAAALYRPFPLGGRGRLTLDPEHLKTYILVFLFLKHLLCALPELLRLSRDPMNEATTDPSRYYPWAVLISVLTVTALGIGFLYLSLRYRRAILREGKLDEALHGRLSAEELSMYEDRVRRGTFRIAGYLFVIGFVFLLTVRLDSYGGLSITPTFLLPTLLFFAHHALVPYLPEARLGRIAALPCLIASLTAFVAQAIYFEKYSFIHILNNETAAARYELVKWTSLAEAVFTVLLLLATLRVACTFVRAYTVCDPSEPTYTAVDRDYHRALRRQGTLTLGCIVLAAVCRCADVFFRGKVQVIFTNTNNSFSGGDTVIAGLFPWFPTFAAVFTVVSLLVATFHLSRLRDAYLLRFPNRDEEA